MCSSFSKQASRQAKRIECYFRRHSMETLTMEYVTVASIPTPPPSSVPLNVNDLVCWPNNRKFRYHMAWIRLALVLTFLFLCFALFLSIFVCNRTRHSKWCIFYLYVLCFDYIDWCHMNTMSKLILLVVTYRNCVHCVTNALGRASVTKYRWRVSCKTRRPDKPNERAKK